MAEQLRALKQLKLVGQRFRYRRRFQLGVDLRFPARHVAQHRLLQAGEFFKEDRQLRGGEQREDQLFDQFGFADGEQRAERLQRDHLRACFS